MHGDALERNEQPYQEGSAAGKAVKSFALKRLIIFLLSGGSLIFILLIGFLLLMTVFIANQTEEEEYGGWEVGGITEFGKNEIPADYIPIYKAAGEEYNVPWNLLAAHHRVETVFSTIGNMRSPVGAIGHMQFMPKTWLGWGWSGGTRLGDASIPESILTSPAKIKQYGGYGRDGNGDGKADPWNLEDAIYSAAYYLAENGAADGNIRDAVFAYNHADWYVDEVLGFADAYVSGYKAIETSPGEVIDGIAWPTPGTTIITSKFGYRDDPFNNSKAFHNGLDIAGAGANGKPIASFRDGTVTYSGYMGGYGNTVIVDHGDGMTSQYSHMSKLQTADGEKVKAGDVIGAIGSTGRSTGPHLHLIVKIKGQYVDPLKYLTQFDYQEI